MPLYDYQCPNCQTVSEDVYHTMHDTASVCCPACGQAMGKMVTTFHTDLHEYRAPIEMYSIAMEDQGEIRAFKRQCPDLDLSDDPRDEMYGVPIARSRKAKLQALAAARHVETN